MTEALLAELAAARLVPVVVLQDADRAALLGESLVAGGIASVEITLRTPAGLDAIRRAAAVTGLLVGAGTVRTIAQLEASVDAGARFVVSPGLDDRVVERALELGVLPVPGTATASDLLRAGALGLDHVKLFPARELGGPAVLRALAGPFPEMRFLPSGGVGAADAREYLALPGVFAVSGSWFVDQDALAAGDGATLQRLARDAADLVDLP